MTSPDHPADPQRRRWLGAVARTGAAAGAAAALSGPARALPAPPAETMPAPEAPRGYHETDRIRRCYALSRY